MGDTWHVVLRDIMIILAAASVVSFTLFTGLVLWQVYRLAIETRDETQPLLDTIRETADSLRATAQFVGQRSVPPALTAVGFTSGAVHLYQDLTRFYRGLRRPDGGPPTEA